MAEPNTGRLSEIVRQHGPSILADWFQEQAASSTRRDDLISPGEVQEQSRRFLELFGAAVAASENPHSDSYNAIRELVGELSRSRARQGFSPSQVAGFIFSLKRPLYTRLQQEL